MIFGVGEFDRLGELACEYGNKPLVVFGQSSAREFGLLDRSIELLKESGMNPVIFEGIEPNPLLTTIQDAARMAIENECDMVIGIGGGSVMDASKVIAFGFFDPDNIWKYVAMWEDDHLTVEQALPIVLASTLAATGSEGDSGAVVTNPETHEKAGVFGNAMFPKVSIIDPQLTLTTPIDYTRDGGVDMASHVLESYINSDDSAPFSDRTTEGFFIEVMDALERVLEKPEDIDARSQLSWLGACALHGFINRPRGGDFPLHMMQHSMSGYFDISHGRGLALLLPRWLKYVGSEKPEKIIQLGDRVFSMELETHHPFEAVDKVIDRIIEWLEDIGAWLFMDDLGIPNDPEIFEKMAQDVIRIYGDKKGVIGGIKPLGKDDIIEIFKMCVRPGAKGETAFPEDEPDEETSEMPEETGEIEKVDDDEVEVVEVIEEVIELEEGGKIPEAKEGEEIIVVEEVIEEEVKEEDQKD